MGIETLGSAAERLFLAAREVGYDCERLSSVAGGLIQPAGRLPEAYRALAPQASSAIKLAKQLHAAGRLLLEPAEAESLATVERQLGATGLRELGLRAVEPLGVTVATQHRFLPPRWAYRSFGGGATWNSVDNEMGEALVVLSRGLGSPPRRLAGDDELAARLSGIGVRVQSNHLGVHPSVWEGAPPILKARRQLLLGLTQEVVARAAQSGRPLVSKAEWRSHPARSLTEASLSFHRAANRLEDLDDLEGAADSYLRSARLIEEAGRRHVDHKEETGLPPLLGHQLIRGFAHAARLYDEADRPWTALVVGLEMVERFLERGWDPTIFKGVESGLHADRFDELHLRLEMAPDLPPPPETYTRQFLYALQGLYETLYGHPDREGPGTGPLRDQVAAHIARLDTVIAQAGRRRRPTRPRKGA